MKVRHFLLLVTALLTLKTGLAQPLTLETPIILPSPSGLHTGQADSEPQGLDSYIINSSQKTSSWHRDFGLLNGIYVTGQYAYSSNHINDIQNVSVPDAPATAQDHVSEKSSAANFALGYQLWSYPFFSPRIEVAYLTQINLDYNANPFLSGIDSTINSSIDSHTLLFKLYNDFQYNDFPLIPYVEGGIGKVYTKVTSNSTVDLFPGVIPPFVGSSSDSQSSRAWDLGVGAKYRIYRSLYLNAGYEYIAMGDGLIWNITYSNPVININPPVFVKLKSGNFYNHTFLVGLTWHPFCLLNISN